MLKPYLGLGLAKDIFGFTLANECFVFMQNSKEATSMV